MNERYAINSQRIIYIQILQIPIFVTLQVNWVEEGRYCKHKHVGNNHPETWGWEDGETESDDKDGPGYRKFDSRVKMELRKLIIGTRRPRWHLLVSV